MPSQTSLAVAGTTWSPRWTRSSHSRRGERRIGSRRSRTGRTIAAEHLEEEDQEIAEADDTDEVQTESEAESVDDTGVRDTEKARTTPQEVVLGSDEDFWLKVGIDPVRMMTSAGTYYTLRCYLDDQPIFLGRNGRISVFGSERVMARYLADEHDHDLSDLATYDDIRTAATDGSLQVNINDDNVYVLTGIADDLADGPDAIDHDQLELAVELLRDVGEYAEDTTVDEAPGRITRWAGWRPTCSTPTRSAARASLRRGGPGVGGAGAVRGVAAEAGVALQARAPL